MLQSDVAAEITIVRCNELRIQKQERKKRRETYGEFMKALLSTGDGSFFRYPNASVDEPASDDGAETFFPVTDE